MYITIIYFFSHTFQLHVLVVSSANQQWHLQLNWELELSIYEETEH